MVIGGCGHASDRAITPQDAAVVDAALAGVTPPAGYATDPACSVPHSVCFTATAVLAVPARTNAASLLRSFGLAVRSEDLICSTFGGAPTGGSLIADCNTMATIRSVEVAVTLTSGRSSSTRLPSGTRLVLTPARIADRTGPATSHGH